MLWTNNIKKCNQDFFWQAGAEADSNNIDMLKSLTKR
jgi:hypothetical protein